MPKLYKNTNNINYSTYFEEGDYVVYVYNDSVFLTKIQIDISNNIYASDIYTLCGREPLDNMWFIVDVAEKGYVKILEKYRGITLEEVKDNIVEYFV